MTSFSPIQGKQSALHIKVLLHASNETLIPSETGSVFPQTLESTSNDLTPSSLHIQLLKLKYGTSSDKLV